MSDRFRSLVRSLNRVAAAVAAFALLALATLITVQVVSRRLFNAPIDFGDEVSGYLLVGLTLLGLSRAMEMGDHIRVEIGLERLPARILRWVRLVWSVVGIAFAAVMSFETAAYALESARLGSVSIDSQIPLAPIQALLPLGFVLLALELIVQFLDVLESRA